MEPRVDERDDKRAAPAFAALAVLAGSQLLIVVDATIVHVALGPIQDGLGFTNTDLPWVITAYTLAFGGLLLVSGRIADRWGHRRIFLAGAAVFGIASFAGGAAGRPVVLVAARAVQGVGAALMVPAALALLMAVYPLGRARTLALGVWAAVTAAGAALGSMLGGVVTAALSWRWVLWINVPVVAAALAAGVAVLPNVGGTRTTRIDLRGAAAVTGGLMALVYGLTSSAEHGWAAGGTVAALLLACVLLSTFMVRQMRGDGQLIPATILRNRAVIAADFVGLVLGIAISALFFFVSLFLSTIRGESPVVVGLAFVPMTVAIAAAARVSGALAGRFSASRLSAAGVALVAAGLALLVTLRPESSYVGTLLPALLLAGGGLGLTFVPLTSAAVGGAEDRDAGIASALFNAGQQIGGAVGLAVLTTISAARTAGIAGAATSAAATTTGWSLAFLVASTLTAGAAVVAATFTGTAKPAP